MSRSGHRDPRIAGQRRLPRQSDARSGEPRQAGRRLRLPGQCPPCAGRRLPRGADGSGRVHQRHAGHRLSRSSHHDRCRSDRVAPGALGTAVTTGRERTPCSGQVAAHREVDGVDSRFGHRRPVRQCPRASTARCRGPDPVTGHGDVEGKLPAEPGPVSVARSTRKIPRQRAVDKGFSASGYRHISDCKGSMRPSSTEPKTSIVSRFNPNAIHGTEDSQYFDSEIPSCPSRQERPRETLSSYCSRGRVSARRSAANIPLSDHWE